MTQESFQAGVHYNDWMGTFAADDEHMKGLADLFKSKGLLKQGEFIVGLQVNLEPQASGKTLNVTALLAKVVGFDNLTTMLQTGEPLQVRKVSETMASHEFFGSFKQLEICFSRKGLLDGKEIQF